MAEICGGGQNRFHSFRLLIEQNGEILQAKELPGTGIGAADIAHDAHAVLPGAPEHLFQPLIAERGVRIRHGIVGPVLPVGTGVRTPVSMGQVDGEI